MVKELEEKLVRYQASIVDCIEDLLAVREPDLIQESYKARNLASYFQCLSAIQRMQKEEAP